MRLMRVGYVTGLDRVGMGEDENSLGQALLS